MAERKKITLAGISVEVTEVEITKRRVEEPNEYELEDGAMIRVPNPVIVVYRIEGPVDAEGNPSYLVKVGTTATVIRGPRKPDGENQGNGSRS